MYLVKTPWWLKRLYPGLTWDISVNDKQVFLTFDDGPHPVATPFVLDVLKDYHAKAMFFCLGKNVEKNPKLFRRILLEGHQVGNHTYQHLNGWKHPVEEYMADIAKAHKSINSNLFRPPYGRITRKQIKDITPEYRVIMWDVLSGDFDVKLNADQCIKNVTSRSKPGSIIVFHDSEKAFPRLQKALPAVLQFFTEHGYSCNAIG